MTDRHATLSAIAKQLNDQRSKRYPGTAPDDGRYVMTVAELCEVYDRLCELSHHVLRLQRGINTAASCALCSPDHESQCVLLSQLQSLSAGLVDAQCALTEITGTMAFNDRDERRLPYFEEY